MAETQTQKALPRIGCDMFHFAKITEDTKTGTTYEEPEWFPGVKAIGFKVGSSVSSFWADDGPYVTINQIGDVATDIELTDLRPADYALVTGAAHDSGLVNVGNPVAPDGASLWRSQKGNGAYRYCRVYKSKYGVPDMEFKTKEQGNANFQTQKLTSSGSMRISDGMVFAFVDSDDPTLPVLVTKEVLDTEWFSDPNFNPKTYTGA